MGVNVIMSFFNKAIDAAIVSSFVYYLLWVVCIQVRNTSNRQIQLFLACYQFIRLKVVFGVEYFIATISLNRTL